MNHCKLEQRTTDRAINEVCLTTYTVVNKYLRFRSIDADCLICSYIAQRALLHCNGILYNERINLDDCRKKKKSFKDRLQLILQYYFI